MKLVSKVVGAAILLAAFAAPGYAGEPGKTKLEPLYDYSHKYEKKTYVKKDGYTYSYTTSKADELNLKEYKRLKEAPKPQPKVVYYTTEPKQTQTYVYTEQKVYQQPPVTCGDYYKYQQTSTCVAPEPKKVITYGCVPTEPKCVHHQKVEAMPVAPVKPPVHMVVQNCDKVITRLKDTSDGQRRYSVCYSDLMHLSQKQRNTVLLDRMEKASVKACRDISMTLYSLRAKKDCAEDTMVAAVYEANLPGLVDAYYISTGKGRPTVKVGDPIM